MHSFESPHQTEIIKPMLCCDQSSSEGLVAINECMNVGHMHDHCDHYWHKEVKEENADV